MDDRQFRIEGGHRSARVTIPYPDTEYLRAVMRLRTFPEIHDLFSKCRDEPKELTESYAAVKKLQGLQQLHGNPGVVFNVGDGAHGRTAAMFALLTKHFSYSIDPALQQSDVADKWAEKFSIERFELIDRRVEDISSTDWCDMLDVAGRSLNLPLGNVYHPVLFTFVHAHVDVDAVLDKYYPFAWTMAYSSACCQEHVQLTRKYKVIEEGDDWAILSPERRYQVFVP